VQVTRCGTTMPRDNQPPSVPATAQQGGQGPHRWMWTEPAVWTERMLDALDKGVKGGKWFRLFDKVFAERNLSASFSKVAANGGAPGVDHITVEAYGHNREANLRNLSMELRDGIFHPHPIRRTFIPKLGSHEQRPLGIPTVRDRIVQGALRHVLEPIFENEFAPCSYGFRPGRGCKDALRRVDELLKSGFLFVVDVDLKSYFDSIPHERLMNRLRERIADGRVLGLVESFLTAGIMNGLDEWEPEAGVPQGAVLSPLLSNIYLNPLDHRAMNQNWQMVRYADDVVVLCRSPSEAEHVLADIRQWCAAEGLTVHPTKTRIVDVRTDGFDFLGYHFKTSQGGKPIRLPRVKSLRKLKDNIRAKTRRTRGESLQRIVADVNQTLRGWFVYFKHSCQTVFTDLDQWIRMRVRSILRKRAGRRGPGRGSDHQRWPNEFFDRSGLYGLRSAFLLACQSPSG
jgi:RNA-directed DNA polymerase